MIKVFKKFLPNIYYNKLNDIVNGDNFQWFFNESNLDTKKPPFKKGKFYFTHNIFDENIGQMSDYYNIFEPILYFIDSKIKVNKLLRVKLNLYTNQNKKIYQGEHCDILDTNNKPLTNSYTGILNFTTCNGGTIINKKQYPSNSNEFIYFKNNTKHYGVIQTDNSSRVVININWK